MIDRNHALPIARQAELVGISRGDVYYVPRGASPADQELMKRIDALNLAHPFVGSRMLRDMLNREGFEVGRRHVATLMRRMGIEALYRKPNTSAIKTFIRQTNQVAAKEQTRQSHVMTLCRPGPSWTRNWSHGCDSSARHCIARRQG